jgi:hypothetical protein
MDVNETISNLKFIAALQSGDKINSIYLQRQPRGFFTSFKRTFLFGDNRQNMINFVRKTVTDALEILIACENTAAAATPMVERRAGGAFWGGKNVVSGIDAFNARNLRADIKRSKIGLSNLKETYSDDLKLNCTLDTILQQIDSILEFETPRMDESAAAPASKVPKSEKSVK